MDTKSAEIMAKAKAWSTQIDQGPTVESHSQDELIMAETDYNPSNIQGEIEEVLKEHFAVKRYLPAYSNRVGLEVTRLSRIGDKTNAE